jgi:hypothetical protein
LAQLYRKQGQTELALQTWAQSLPSALVIFPEIMQRFVSAAGGENRANHFLEQHRLDSQHSRTIEIPNPAKISASGEVYVLIGRDGIESMEVVDGSEKMKMLAPQLRAAKTSLTFPDEQEIKLIRSGVLSCVKSSPTCMFVLVPPPAIQVMDDRF